MSQSPLYLVDSSAWARAGHAPVAARLADLAAAGVLACATPQVLEIMYSARNAAEWDQTEHALRAFTFLEASKQSDELAQSLQEALMRAGKLRSVGPMDLLIAGLARAHGATVVHYDSDYDHVASVDPEFRHEWIVPRGTAS